MTTYEKVFKHRFYFASDEPFDEVLTWEEANEKWKKYNQVDDGIYMVSKYFDTITILPPKT
jgi:hypothetical protein